MKIFSYSVLAFVGVAVILGLYLSGSPGEARREAMDEVRRRNIQSVQSVISVYYEQKGELPDKLEDLDDQSSSLHGIQANFKDPRTEEPYEYRVVDAKSYEICATFETEFTFGEGRKIKVMPGEIMSNSFDQHTAGRHCVKTDVTTYISEFGMPLPVPASLVNKSKVRGLENIDELKEDNLVGKSEVEVQTEYGRPQDSAEVENKKVWVFTSADTNDSTAVYIYFEDEKVYEVLLDEYTGSVSDERLN